MGRQLRVPLVQISLIAVLCLCGNIFAFDATSFQSNFDSNNGEINQTALTCHIDSLTIIRDRAEFHLANGELSLFDFGSGVPCALVFVGQVSFKYTPPNEIERYQLERLYDCSAIDKALDSLVLFYTDDLDQLPDTTLFRRKPITRPLWDKLASARDDAFDYLDEYLPNKILNNLFTSRPKAYFYADMPFSINDHLVFIEDYRFDDIYRLYKLYKTGGKDMYDVLGGYSPRNCPASGRNILPIFIYHYDINSVLERGGEMTVDCRISYMAKHDGCRFLYWQWYDDNEPIAAFDSQGDSLTIIHKDKEYGFGVMLNKPLVALTGDYIDIRYKCNAIRNFNGIYFVEGQTYWYPLMLPHCPATFDLRFTCNKDYEVISCGKQAETSIADGLRHSHWVVDVPVRYVSFNLGVFKSKIFRQDDGPITIVYQGENFRHGENDQKYIAITGDNSSRDMFEDVGKDVSSSSKFYTEHLGPCPFDTIRVSEIPYGFGQGSPGLVHLSWYTFQFDDLIGSGERFRAHEVAHQWFGHIVSNENYRDTWITEGLAEYCAFMYYESIVKDKSSLSVILDNWRRDIMYGREMAVYSTDDSYSDIDNYIKAIAEGSIAGPMILGTRLNNSKSYDYQNTVYTKGAYVFHMIRYMMHDYETGSDEAFWKFLRDFLFDFKEEIPLETESFKLCLEYHLNQDMTWFFYQWIYGIDIPSCEFSYKVTNLPVEEYIIECRVLTREMPDGFKMLIPIGVYSEMGNTSYFNIEVDKQESVIKLPPVEFKPQGIDFNINDAVLCGVKQ